MSDTELAQAPVEAENPSHVATEADAESLQHEGAESAPAADDAGKQSEPTEAERIRFAMQKRIDKLTAINARLRAQGGQVQPEAKSQPDAPVSAPTLESVGFDEGKYQAEMLAFLKAEARAEAERAIYEREQHSQQQAKATEFEQRQAEFIKSKPDYADKVLNNSSLPISPVMADMIRDSEIGPEVAYHLSEHPDLASAIAGLPEKLQIREIGRIEARLEALKDASKEAPKAAPIKPVVSQAPPPAPKIEATAAAPRIKLDSPEADSLSDAEWGRIKQKQRTAKR